MRKWKVVILPLFFVQIGFAQAPPSRLLTQFKYTQLTGGVVMLKGTFDHFKDSLNFILDTGSGGISLDSSTAARYLLKGTPSERIIRGIAGIRKISFLNNRQLHLPGLTIDSLNFHITDYNILTSVYGEKVDGIIGYSVLKKFIIKINYDSSFIQFWTKGSIKYPRGGFLLRPVINNLPVHELKVRDGVAVSSRFLYDMGAGLNLMVSQAFVTDSNFLQKKRKLYTKEAEGVGGKIDMYLTVIKQVTLGPYKFRKVPTYIFEDSFNVTAYPRLAGLIGNDLLRRFNVILNYGMQQIYLLSNSHFHDPFDYSYSGLELYFVDGQIVLGDVAKNSPAEKAGLKEGDLVMAVNNNFSQNLNQYKLALQNAGSRIKLIVMRNGDLREFEVKIKSIL